MANEKIGLIDVTTGVAVANADARFAKGDLTGNLVVPKESGLGIKLDTASPVFGWRDLVGQITPRASGGPAPAFTAYRGSGILQHAFAVNDVIDNITFHMPHDYVVGTDIYIHPHWGHNGTAISGSFAISWYATYCKGYNQASQTFNSPLTITQSISITSTTTHPQWGHFIDEFALTNAGGDSTHLDRGLLEVDGLIIIGALVTGIPTITGSATSNLPYMFMVDLHYQSTGIPTKGRNYPNFYS
jgi:hypothetical protein